MFKDTHIDHCTNCGIDCCLHCLPTNESNIFECLTRDEMNFMMKSRRNVVFKPGETLIKQNTTSSHFVCIREGLAKIVAEGANGKNVILKLVAQRGLITAGGVLSEDVRHFTVTAITTVECCFIDSKILQLLFEKNSAFAYELLKYNNNQNIRMLNSLVSLTQKYMPGRVADTLLYLKNEVYKSNPFTYDLKKTEFAEMSDMTKESFIRNLKELESSHIIKKGQNTIEILDEKELVKISRNG